MRQELSERLLIGIMEWSPAEMARERPILQALAAFKYDEYQQFLPGTRFMGSLAMWLAGFKTIEDRRVAYEFMRRELIFFTEQEIRQLVDLVAPDIIKPVLRAKVAKDLGLPSYAVSRIVGSPAFKRSLRSSLFLGLSDGARIDVLRRKASLDNEQVHATYQLSDQRAGEMLDELTESLNVSSARFQSVFLLDDFSGSGDSLIIERGDGVKGKLAKCFSHLASLNKNTQFLADAWEAHVVIYIASQKASTEVRNRIATLRDSNWPTNVTFDVVYQLPQTIKVTDQSSPDFDKLLEKYYDPAIMTKHLLKGGDNVIHGYASCGLPLVLPHNAPNNSVHLLWATDSTICPPLFPRISRHREE